MDGDEAAIFASLNYICRSTPSAHSQAPAPSCQSQSGPRIQQPLRSVYCGTHGRVKSSPSTPLLHYLEPVRMVDGGPAQVLGRRHTSSRETPLRRAQLARLDPSARAYQLSTNVEECSLLESKVVQSTSTPILSLHGLCARVGPTCAATARVADARHISSNYPNPRQTILPCYT